MAHVMAHLAFHLFGAQFLHGTQCTDGTNTDVRNGPPAPGHTAATESQNASNATNEDGCGFHWTFGRSGSSGGPRYVDFWPKRVGMRK